MSSRPRTRWLAACTLAAAAATSTVIAAPLPEAGAARTAADAHATRAPIVDLAALDAERRGPRAQVLVLGTVHLGELPQGFDRAVLDTVLDRLAAFRPDVVTIEALPGTACDAAARMDASFRQDYCPSTDEARTATKLDIPAATAEVRRALKSWPKQPGPSDRRHLAALFLASGDRASALVQWLQLPQAERHAGDGLDAALVALLVRVESLPNENYQVAARLAARLGLQRVFPVDDHTGDDIEVEDETAFEREVRAAWAAGQGAMNDREARSKALTREKDLLPLYRFINEPEHLRGLAAANERGPLTAPPDHLWPRVWVAGWEIRNLRMVANVREAFRERPGARVLSIVGVSHKPWFDDGLGRLPGVDIVDAGQVLR